MIQSFYKLFLVFSIIIFSLDAKAAHIVGGDVTYECLGLDTLPNGNILINLRIEFNMYRDAFSNGAPFNNPAEIGIYSFNGNNYSHINTRDESIDEQGQVDVMADTNPCIIFPPDVGVDRARYTFEITLPLLTGVNEGYSIAYQRCCRNETINNLVGPGDTGAAFSVEITSAAMQICNNSPTFDNFPPVVICNGQDINFNHGATDVDGHQIFYEFCAPLTAGGQDGANGGGDPTSCTGVTPDPSDCAPPFDEVTFQLPNFSSTNPMGGSPQITIDPVTGLISGVPLINGQFVVGVCAREVFNGTVISEIRRDFQFNVTNCDPFIEAVISPQGQAQIIVENNEEFIVSCGEPELTFIHDGSTDNINSYTWFAQINGITQFDEGISATFDFQQVGEYYIVLYTNFGSPCQERDSLQVKIFPDLFAEFSSDYDTCTAGDVFYDDLSTLETMGQSLVDWEWNFNQFGSSNVQNPMFQFPQPGVHPVELIITDNNGCRDSITRDIPWTPAPPLLIVQPSTFLGCAPADVFFNNLSFPIDSTYIFEWDFGDGSFGDEISPTHTYTETGQYTVSLTVTSPSDCTISDASVSMVELVEKPTADFSFTPEVPNVFNPTVEFFDNSIGAQSWQWNFGDGTVKFEPNTNHTFQDTGVYEVSLTVRHNSGCTDTLTKIIDIEPIVRFHMPNAFTPNGDATNDILKGNGFFDGIQNFRYTIWNRWGEKIFETNDPYSGWNGRKNNSGRDSPSGVYIYEINFLDPRGKMENLRGHASLLR